MKKQSLIKGTLVLGVAAVLARFMGLFFRIPVQKLIGDEGMGYYQMSYPLYMTFVALASGIPIAMSKLISEYNIKGKYGCVKEVLRQTMRIMIPIGIIASFIMVFFSKNIVHMLKWDMKSYESFIVISLAPVFVCIMCTFRGYFQGLQNMTYTGISQVIEQFGRVIFGVLLSWLLVKKNIGLGAAGAATGTLAGGILGSIYLLLAYMKRRGEGAIKNVSAMPGEGAKIRRAIMTAALPISVGAAVSTIMSLIDSIIVPQRLLNCGYSLSYSATLYGQLTGKAVTIQNVPLAISMALCSVLVPVISEAYAINNRYELKRRVNMVFKLAMVIAIPSFLGLFYLAMPIMSLIFLGDCNGYEILKYLSIGIPFIIITQITTSLLQSLGRYMIPVYNLVIGCLVKVIITYIMVGNCSFNIYGAVIGTIAGYIITAALNMIRIKKIINIKISIMDVLVKPLLASLIMIITVVFLYNNVYNYTVSIGISCITAIFLGIIVFVILIFLLKIFSINDVKDKFGRS